MPGSVVERLDEDRKVGQRREPRRGDGQPRRRPARLRGRRPRHHHRRRDARHPDQPHRDGRPMNTPPRRSISKGPVMSNRIASNASNARMTADLTRAYERMPRPRARSRRASACRSRPTAPTDVAMALDGAGQPAPPGAVRHQRHRRPRLAPGHRRHALIGAAGAADPGPDSGARGRQRCDRRPVPRGRGPGHRRHSATA